MCKFLKALGLKKSAKPPVYKEPLDLNRAMTLSELSRDIKEKADKDGLTLVGAFDSRRAAAIKNLNEDKYDLAEQQLNGLDVEIKKAAVDKKSYLADYKGVPELVTGCGDILGLSVPLKVFHKAVTDAEKVRADELKPETQDFVKAKAAVVPLKSAAQAFKVAEGIFRSSNVEYKKYEKAYDAAELVIADLEKETDAGVKKNVEVAVAAAKNDLKATVTLAAQSKFTEAISAIDTIVKTECPKIEKWMEEYRVLNGKKKDTDVKVKRLNDNTKSDLVKDELKQIKVDVVNAMVLADPPGRNYSKAFKALVAVDKASAKAESTILDKVIKKAGITYKAKRKAMEEVFAMRFGVTLEAEKGDEDEDTKTQSLEALKRVFELMAMVPESHATNNTSLKDIKRIGGKSQTSYYDDTAKQVVLQCGRPGVLGGTQLLAGLGDPTPVPPLDPECEPKPGNTDQDYFDWTTNHEIGHAVDDKKSFMKDNSDPKYGGWEVPTVDDVAAIAATTKAIHTYPTAVAYLKEVLTGTEGSRPGVDVTPAAPNVLLVNWAADLEEAAKWCDSVRVGKAPWKNPPAAVNGRVYHESYKRKWVSYLYGERTKAIRGYQFRAPGEWFAELYAAFQAGVLKKGHPAMEWLKKL